MRSRTSVNDDANFETITSVSAPAGGYVLIAKGVFDETSGDRAREFSAGFRDHEAGDLTDRPFALTSFTSSTTGVEFTVECGGAWDDIGVKNTRLVALRIS